MVWFVVWPKGRRSKSMVQLCRSMQPIIFQMSQLLLILANCIPLNHDILVNSSELFILALPEPEWGVVNEGSLFCWPASLLWPFAGLC